MASYLRPKRGKRATAEAQNIVLKRGELFMEAPDAGVGKGQGRIKIGDGMTVYSALPYFYDPDDFASDLGNTPIAFTATTDSDNVRLLNKIVTGAKLGIVIAAVQNILANLIGSVSTLEDSMEEIHPNSYTLKVPVSPSTTPTEVGSIWIS